MKKHTNFWKEIYHKSSESDWLDIAIITAIILIGVTLALTITDAIFGAEVVTYEIAERVV
jgi:hypothetical protein